MDWLIRRFLVVDIYEGRSLGQASSTKAQAPAPQKRKEKDHQGHERIVEDQRARERPVPDDGAAGEVPDPVDGAEAVPGEARVG